MPRFEDIARQVWPLSLEGYFNLLELDAMFWSVFTQKGDQNSSKTLFLLKSFLQNHKCPVPVVEVAVKSVVEASLLKLAILPQHRLYHRGREICRTRGVASVEDLSTLYLRTLS